jgi:hypothetical protein
MNISELLENNINAQIESCTNEPTDDGGATTAATTLAEDKITKKDELETENAETTSHDYDQNQHHERQLSEYQHDSQLDDNTDRSNAVGAANSSDTDSGAQSGSSSSTSSSAGDDDSNSDENIDYNSEVL